MEMPSVYLETTVPSYLVARPSRDLIVTAHQQIAQEWWDTARDRFDLYISEAILDEIRAGDAEYAARRTELLAEVDILAFSDDVEALIRAYHRRLGLVGSATADLPHFAYAVAYNMDYLRNLELQAHREWPSHQATQRRQRGTQTTHARDRYA